MIRNIKFYSIYTLPKLLIQYEGKANFYDCKIEITEFKKAPSHLVIKRFECEFDKLYKDRFDIRINAIISIQGELGYYAYFNWWQKVKVRWMFEPWFIFDRPLQKFYYALQTILAVFLIWQIYKGIENSNKLDKLQKSFVIQNSQIDTLKNDILKMQLHVKEKPMQLKEINDTSIQGK